MAATPPQGTISKLIDRLTNSLNEHPGEEELLGAIPLIAGAWLSASPRRGWQGVGNALAVAGGLGELDAQTRVSAKAEKDAKQQAARSAQAFAGSLKPGQSIQDVINSAAKTGISIPEALDVYKASQGPKEGTPQKITMNGISGLAYPSGRTEWLAKGEDFYSKPSDGSPKSAFALWQKQNPNGTYADFENQSDAIKAKYQKQPQVNVSFGGYGTDNSGNPVAIERNPKTGAMTSAPLPKGVVPAGLRPKAKYTPGQIVQIGGVNGGSYQYRNGAKGIGLYRVGKKGLYASAKEALGGASLPDFIDPNGELPSSAPSASPPPPPPGFE